jgi:hypothetical protein
VAADWSSDLGLLCDNHLSGFFQNGGESFCPKLTDEEISNFKENAVPKSTKEAKKFGLKLFRGRKLRCCRILLNFIWYKTSFYFINCRTIV